MIPQLILDHWAIIAVSGFIIGLDKGGIKPLIIFAIFLVTSIMEPTMMLAVFAPLLFLGEIFPAFHYRHDADTAVVWKILPWATAGLLLGAAAGTRFSEEGFGLFIAFTILSMGILLAFMEFHPISLKRGHETGYRVFLGLLAGIVAVISNVASGISNIYMLYHIREKRAFIGANSLLYLFVTGAKIIIYLVFWDIFTEETLLVSLWLLPPIVLGLAAATFLIRIIPENVYRTIVLGSVFYAGIAMLVRYL